MGFSGIPINKEGKLFGVNKRLLWDTMHLLAEQPKTTFIFSATSKAFNRMQIMDCIRKKFKPDDFESEITLLSLFSLIFIFYAVEEEQLL